jgi:uncharacterized protein involved in exopolysaccharide biosynthesis
MDSEGLRSATRSPDGAIDVTRLFAALRRRKSWILLPTLAAFCAGLAFVTLVSPRYTAVTKVVLVSQESYFTRPDKGAPALSTPLLYDPEGVQSESESVATEGLARKAVQKLGLTKNREFNPPPGPLGMLRALFGGGDRGTDAEDRATAAFLSRLTVFPIVKSRVLQIEFSCADPVLAATAANTTAQLYLDSKEDAKRASIKAASEWLAGKIEDLRRKAAAADAKAEAYRTQSGLLAGSGGVTLPTQQLTELAAQIAAARAAEAAATSKAQLLRRMLREGRLDAAIDVAKDESLRRYAEARVTLKAQIAEEGRTLLPGHPRMRELAGELAGLEAEIRAAATKAVRGFEDDAKLAATQVASLQAAVAKQSATVAEGNGDEVRLRELELDAKTARAQLESYLEKYHEALAHEADDAEPANARILSVAITPRAPTFPKKIPTLVLSALAGFFLSVGAAIARALLVDPPVVEVARESIPAPISREPIVAQAPPATRASASPDPAEAPSEALDALVDRLAGASTPGVCLPVMITADGSGGALAPALAAARRLSRFGGAVLLDLGASQPWLADVFDHSASNHANWAALSDVLAGRTKFVDALHHDLSSAVDILPAGAGEIPVDGLPAVLDVLSESYAFLVIHASDWRRPAALAALDRVAAVIICAPESRLPRAEQRLRDLSLDPSVAIVGLAIGAPVEEGQATRIAAAG